MEGDFPSPEDLDRVTFMFPGVSPYHVRRDLRRTNNLELTINNILDGQLPDSENEDELSDHADVTNSIDSPVKSTRGIDQTTSEPLVSHHSKNEDKNKNLNSGIITFSTSDYLSQLQSNMSDSEELPDLSSSKLASATGKVNAENMSRDTYSLMTSPQRTKAPKIGRSKMADEMDPAEKKRQKEEEKLARVKEREAKKKAKDLEAAKKRAILEARKHSKPGECMKLMTMIVDPSIMKYPCGAALLIAVQDIDMKVEVQSQPLPNIITFWREVTDVKEVDGVLQTDTHEVVEDHVILWLPVEDFVSLVQAYHQSKSGLLPPGSATLRSHVQAIRMALENRPVTLLVQGLNKYYKMIQQAGRGAGRGKKATSANECLQSVSHLEVEEALVDLQIMTNTNICPVETDQEMAKSVLQYAKAIAETPFKRDRLNTAFNFHVESSGSVRVDKDGRGVSKLWRQQIQQFRSVSAEVANAIIASYPTPKVLYEAYQNCSTEGEAELLLADIVVRRGFGVMETSRRVGPELSKKMYMLMTSKDPSAILK